MSSAHCFTIITPLFNRQELIIETLESVWRQSYRPVEHIVVDDGSADLSFRAVDNWKNSLDTSGDPHYSVRLMRQKNQGPSVARNTALACVTGEYVMYLDSDDLLEKDALNEMAQIFESQNADMVFAGFRRFDHDSGKVLFSSIPIQGQNLVARALEGVVWANASRFAIRRDFACRLGHWNPKLLLFEDRDYGERAIMRAESPAILPKSIVRVRTNSGARQNDQLRSRRGRKFRIMCEKNLLSLAYLRCDVSQDSWASFKSRLYGLSFRSYASGWPEHGRSAWELAESIAAPLDVRGRRRRLAARLGWVGGVSYVAAGYLAGFFSFRRR